MIQLKNKRKTFFANALHREMFFLVFFAMVIPLIITTIGMFYFVFYIFADEIGMPEAIAYTVYPAARRVLATLFVVLPLAMVAILWVSHRVTHRMVGPFHRIVYELEKTLQGERKGPIKLREGDRFAPLVDLINKLIKQ